MYKRNLFKLIKNEIIKTFDGMNEIRMEVKINK